MSRQLAVVLWIGLAVGSVALWFDAAIRRAFRCFCEGCDA